VRRWAMVDRLIRVRVGEKEDRLFAPLTRRVDRVVVGSIRQRGAIASRRWLGISTQANCSHRPQQTPK
jgi:hypothetical protein